MTAPKETVKADGSGRLTPWRFAGLLGLLLFIVFPDVILGWKSFFHHDFSVFDYPLAHFLQQSFWRGELPFWNPLNNGGLPFLAQWNTMALYPGTLVYQLFPLPWSLGAFCIGHLFLGGLGMYFLAWRWTDHRLAAGVAGLAFALNGFAQCAVEWRNNISALALMPWFVLVAEQAWQTGGRRWVVAVLVGGVQMLTGAPEIILFTWFVTGLMFLESCGRERAKIRTFLLRFLSLGLIVGCLAAIQLLPFLDLLKHSQRDAGYADTFYSMPATGWANLLLPLFRCYESRYGVYFQFDQHWTSSYYLGIGVLLLAGWAVFKWRSPRVGILAGIAVFGLLMALGDNGFLYPLLRQTFPALGFMNFPIKFIVLVAFSIPLLAAFGLAHLQQCEPARRRWLFAMAFAFAAMIAGIVLFDAAHPEPRLDWRVTLQNGAGRTLFLVLTMSALYWVGRVNNLKTARWLELGVLVFIAADLLTFAPKQNPTISPGILAPRMEHADMSPPPRHGESRVWIDPQTHLRIATSRLTDPTSHLIALRLMLHLNLNLLDGIPKMNGFFSLYLREAEEVKSLCDYYGPEKVAALFNFLAISHVPATKELQWQRRDGYLPMITGGQLPEFAGAKETLQRLASPGVDLQKTVFLSPEAKSILTVTNNSDVKIEAIKATPNRIDFDVIATQSALVTIAQTYYHPWRAYVDGTRRELWRANHSFQAIEVPAGAHHVTLKYEDNQFITGAWVSVATLMLCLGTWIYFGRQRPG